MAKSREQIEEIHTAMSDVAELSSTNTENMNTLLEEVSVFTLVSDGDSDSSEELGVKIVDSDQ
jgi:predicted translin family RNA/ssDNA-binding protein